MPEALAESIRFVGLSHLVVASGFHLAVIASLGKKIFGKISRLLGLVMSIVLVVVFISISGISPSMARAGIITVAATTVAYTGRKMHPARSVLYAIGATLLINPSQITSMSWLLSFSAYVGIIFIAPLITRVLFGIERPNVIESGIVASISAQLLCMPITIYFYGTISLLGIFLSVLISPTIPITMALSAAVGMGLTILRYPLELLLKAHLLIINSCANYRWGLLNIESGNPMIFAIYIPIIVLFLALYKIEKYKFKPSVALDNSPEYGKIYLC